MPAARWLKLSKYQYIFAILLGVTFSNTSSAFAFTADEVVNSMSERERSVYLAGIVDGLAQARWIADRPDQTGMSCIYNWYYQGGDTTQATIRQWFSRHLDKEANGLLYVLVERECGT